MASDGAQRASTFGRPQGGHRPPRAVSTPAYWCAATPILDGIGVVADAPARRDAAGRSPAGFLDRPLAARIPVQQPVWGSGAELGCAASVTCTRREVPSAPVTVRVSVAPGADAEIACWRSAMPEI